MANKENSTLNIAVIRPDLGIGGAERLIVDAAVELSFHGHKVHVFTVHHDKNRCFEETVSGTFPVTVYGAFLPRHIFYRLHAFCAYLRCLFVAFCVLVMWPSFDVVLVDLVSVVNPLLKLKKSTKVVFYCHFPDLLLAQHITLLRRIYRKPIDLLEEMTTGMADLIIVNSKFTASTFANTFKHLDAQGIQPYPAVNVDQFEEPKSSKGGRDALQGLNLDSVTDYCRMNTLASFLWRQWQHKNLLLHAIAGDLYTVKNGATGYLCDPTPRDFSLAMAKFIQDPQLAERMGIEARQHVTESFSTNIFGRCLNRYVVNVARSKKDR